MRWLILFLSVFIVTSSYWIHTKTQVDMPPLSEREALTEYWKTQIRHNGADATYAALLKKAQDYTLNEQHLFGHVFGGALYQVAGIDGFPVCDTSLTDGCHHEFIAQAMLTIGEDSFAQLGDKCHKYFDELDAIGCEHGLGHGLTLWFGYDLPSLRKSLRQCDTISSKSHIRGCMGGVFMEYHLHTSGDGFIRKEEPADIYAPCTHLDEKYRRACYFWLPQWWMGAHFPEKENRSHEAFSKAGTYCSQAPEHRDACFGGIGYLVAPTVSYEKEAAAQLCAHVAHGERNVGYNACHKEAVEGAMTE